MVSVAVVSGDDRSHCRAVSIGVLCIELGPRLEREIRAMDDLVETVKTSHSIHASVDNGDIDACTGPAEVMQLVGADGLKNLGQRSGCLIGPGVGHRWQKHCQH